MFDITVTCWRMTYKIKILEHKYYQSLWFEISKFLDKPGKVNFFNSYQIQ